MQKAIMMDGRYKVINGNKHVKRVYLAIITEKKSENMLTSFQNSQKSNETILYLMNHFK